MARKSAWALIKLKTLPPGAYSSQALFWDPALIILTNNCRFPCCPRNTCNYPQWPQCDGHINLHDIQAAIYKSDLSYTMVSSFAANALIQSVTNLGCVGGQYHTNNEQTQSDECII